MIADIKCNYLETTMNPYKYMRILVDVILKKIMHQYNLAPLNANNFVSVEISNGMYGLPQAEIMVKK